jgi:site-specific recombinase XerD
LIEDWLDDWISAGRSKTNGESYVRCLTRLSAVLAAEDKTLADATSSDLRAFVREVSDGLKPCSRAYAIRAVKAFYRLAEDLDLPNGNVAAKLEAPQQPWGEARTIDTATHEKVIASITSRQMDYWDRRDVALLEVACSRALRISEICNMDWEHLDLELQLVTVTKSKTASGLRQVVRYRSIPLFVCQIRGHRRLSRCRV